MFYELMTSHSTSHILASTPCEYDDVIIECLYSYLYIGG